MKQAGKASNRALPEDHWAFTDEKGSGRERYWGIGVVSGSASALSALRQDLSGALGKLESLEWKDINGDSQRQRAAQSYIETAVAAVCKGVLRVDVLMWDTHDSRHAVQGRDDSQNVGRMYYHVLTHCGRMCGQRRWRLYPDDGSCLDWEDIALYIRRTRVVRSKPYLISLFEEGGERFEILEVSKQDSRKEPLVQLADIFVGMGCFSVDRSDKLKRWTEEQNRRSQLVLLPELDHAHDAQSRSERARFELVAGLNGLCKATRLGVSLERRWHLWTPAPRAPINFWMYKPQHDSDKAPTRRKG